MCVTGGKYTPVHFWTTRPAKVRSFECVTSGTPGIASLRPVLQEYSFTVMDVTGCSSGGVARSRQRTRIRWTEPMRWDLMSLYRESEPDKIGYVRRLEKLWREKHPNLLARGTALAVECHRLKSPPQPTGTSVEKPMEAVCDVYGGQATGSSVDRSALGNEASRAPGPAE